MDFQVSIAVKHSEMKRSVSEVIVNSIDYVKGGLIIVLITLIAQGLSEFYPETNNVIMLGEVQE
jgi:hypothetical protein